MKKLKFIIPVVVLGISAMVFSSFTKNSNAKVTLWHDDEHGKASTIQVPYETALKHLNSHPSDCVLDDGGNYFDSSEYCFIP